MNNRNSFTSVLAIAVVLVLLGGGANAFAGPTVRCVPSPAIDPSCTPTTYATIQVAVTAAAAGDIILVGPGTYAESVTIPSGKDNLSLFGARAGKDAREDRTDPTKESIVNASGLSAGSAIIVEALNVLIDGFTVEGGADFLNGTGIDLKGSGGGLPGFTPANGAKVVNNIVQDNETGLSLNSEGFGPVSNVLVEHNLFRHNNAGRIPSSGDGIFSSACNNVVITENKFTGNHRLAIGINNSNDVTITYNQADMEVRFVVFDGTTNSEFGYNRGKRFVFSAIDLTTPPRQAAVSVRGGNSLLTVNDNHLEGGAASSLIKGIQFGPGESANTHLTVSYNEIEQMPDNGIVAGMGTLTNSLLLGNEVEHSGVDGIFLNTGNLDNFLFENKSEDNGALDCHDSSIGTKTLSTANTWFRNAGETNSPLGLCKEKKED